MPEGSAAGGGRGMWTWRLPMALLSGLVAVALAACGSGDEASTESSAATAGSAAATTGSSSSSVADDALQDLYEGATFEEPPVQDPPAPKPGAKVWVVDYGLAASAGAEFAEATEAAGELMGWDVTVVDGKYNPSAYLAGIREAIAAKADAIVLYAIDCPGVRAGLQAADRAGIPVIAAESVDCDKAGEGGEAEPLFDAEVAYTQGDFLDWSRAFGEAQAVWTIAATNGEAKVINLFETDIIGLVEMNKGFVDGMAQCETCEIVETIEFLGTDLGPALQERVQQALIENPDANAIRVPYDAIMTSGVAQAIVASGRSDDLQVIAGEGQGPNVDLVRSGRGQDAGIGTDITWTGYHAMDTVNRVLAGEEPVPSGIGLQVYDAEHNLPESGGWEPPIDPVPVYRSAYGAADGE